MEHSVIRLLFVCHGNICRSPMAQSVMAHLAAGAGADWITADSAATSTEEIGRSPHSGTCRELSEQGIPLVPHRAVQMTRADYDRYDLLIGMDSANLRNMDRITGGDPDGKFHRLLDWTDRPGNIADPWYTGDFDETYADVLAGCQGLLKALLEK